jgi:hypothetical protein
MFQHLTDNRFCVVQTPTTWNGGRRATGPKVAVPSSKAWRWSLVLLVLLALGAYLVLTAVSARAADVKLVEYGANPVYDPPSASDKAYYPCVLYDGNRFSGHGASNYYKMWYADGQGQFEAVTYSDDGVSWSAPVETTGILASGYHAKVIYIPDGYSAAGGTYYYKIWYWDSAVHDVPYTIDGIRTADSVDGVNWANDNTITQNASAPLVTGVSPDWNTGTYGPVCILYNPSASNTGTDPFDYTFAMYYDGTTGGVESIGLGYSADGNTDWQIYGSGPVLDHGTTGDWDSDYAAYGTVIHGADGVWRMWYSGSGPSGEAHQGIGYATSADGLHWTKDPGNPLFSMYQGVAWRDARCYTPSVLCSSSGFDGHGAGASYKMWFTGEASATGNRTIGLAMSAPPVVWVNPAYSSGGAGGHTFGYDAFNTIQTGINGVASGGTAHVASATYHENIIIGKPLTMTSDSGAASTVIDCDNGNPYVVYVDASNVTFDGFTVQSPTYDGGSDASGIVLQGDTGAVSNIRVTNNTVHDIGRADSTSVTYGRVGINVGCGTNPGDSIQNVEVDHNTIYNIKHADDTHDVWANGISIWGQDSVHIASGINVHDNVIHDVSCPKPRAAGISVQPFVQGLTLQNNTISATKDYGIELRGGSLDAAQVLGNDIQGPAAVAGIRLSDPYATSVTGNTVTGCATGVLVADPEPVWGAPSAVPPVVELNRFGGNATYGLDNQITAATDATRNWWGSAYGPWTASNTGADKVNGNATSAPWCTNPQLTEIVSRPLQVEPLVTAGIFAIPVNASEGSTPYLKAADQIGIEVGSGTATHNIIMPSGTSMRNAAGGNIDTSNVVTTFLSPGSLSGFQPNTVVDAALLYGIPGITMNLDSPIAVRLYVGPGLEGNRLTIIRSATGNSGWTGDGIDTVSPAVSGGYVTFNTSKTSYFAAVSLNRTIPVSPTVTSITPSTGTQGLTVSVTNLAGTGFQAGATVKLKKTGQTDITATSVNVVSPTKITCSFNLSSAAPGAWDVFVQNPDTQSASRVGAFTVKSAPTSTWYLAEGSTAWGFDCYISIENPNPSALTAKVTYMPTGSANVVKTVSLPPKSQTTFNPADVLGQKDFSTKVQCTDPTKPIAVDRTMTWTGPGAPSPEAHSSVGVTSPATTWYLPEGSTNWNFETWLLIQNPNSTTANCTVTYMTSDAGPKVVNHDVPANARASFSMATDIGNKDASIKVTSNVSVIPERAMYRNNRREGHDSIGTTTPASDCYLAEGTSAWGFTTYVLVQNPNNASNTVTVTYMTPSGSRTPVASYAMAPNSRMTVRVNDVLADTDFSTQVHGSLPVIAERSMYWGADHPLGEACHDSIGMAAAHTTFYLPDGQTSSGKETWTLVQNPNSTAVSVEVSYMPAGGGATMTVTTTINANSRMTFNMDDKVPNGRASIMVTSKTFGKKILVERAMYWNNRGAGTSTIGGFSD